MPQQWYESLLNSGDPWQTSQGTALSASASTATISPQAPTAQDFVLPQQPSGLQWYKGMSLTVKARGKLGSGGTASNLTVLIAAGVSGTLGTTLATTAAFALGTGSLSNLPWELEAQIDCVGLRTDANPFLASDGMLRVGNATTPALGTANGLLIPLPYTTVNGSSLSPWTAATALGLKATLSAAFGNIQCDRFTIEQIS